MIDDPVRKSHSSGGPQSPAESAAARAAGHRPVTRAELFAHLARLGIETVTVDHPAVFTVAESEALERAIAGGHTKNLFLKDAKGALFLVVAESHTAVDLKALSQRLGAARFSFGKPDLLMQRLGVTPGSVTAFAALNDHECCVTVVVDVSLMRHEMVNCHPLDNAATTSIAREDLFRFLSASGHPPRVLALGSDADQAD
jgi:Ala-tRNA(Pro) deacylase